MSEPKHIKEIMQQQFAEIRLRREYNPRGMMYYPECNVSKAILNMMGRKAFTKDDLLQLEGLGAACGGEPTKIILVARE